MPLFFPASSVLVSDGFLHVLGAGWECFWITEFPYQTQIALAFMVEFGSIDQNVLLGFEFVLKDPAGAEHTLGTADVAVPESRGLITRRSEHLAVPIDLAAPGVYVLSVRSGGEYFAQYTFEARQALISAASR